MQRFATACCRLILGHKVHEFGFCRFDEEADFAEGAVELFVGSLKDGNVVLEGWAVHNQYIVINIPETCNIVIVGKREYLFKDSTHVKHGDDGGEWIALGYSVIGVIVLTV